MELQCPRKVTDKFIKFVETGRLQEEPCVLLTASKHFKLLVKPSISLSSQVSVGCLWKCCESLF